MTVSLIQAIRHHVVFFQTGNMTQTIQHIDVLYNMGDMRTERVHLSAENTALVQGIRCEPLCEHLIPWTRAVFFHTARK